MPSLRAADLPSGQWRRRRRDRIEPVGQVEAVEKRLHDPFQAKIIQARDHSHPRRLVGQRLARPRQVNVGDLEQSGIADAVSLVVGPGCQQARHEALPEGTVLLEIRVLGPDRRLDWLRIERRDQLVRHQAESHRLVESESRHRLADGPLDPLPPAETRRRQRHGLIFGNVLISMNTGRFLDQVDLPLQVAPPARRPESGRSAVPSEPLQPQRLEDRRDSIRRDVDPQHPADLVEPQGDLRPPWRRPRGHVDDPFVQGPAGEFQDQLDATPTGPLGPLRIDRPLEAVA